MHHIQKYILDKLIFSEFLRNRDMRPPSTESNLYQYHLKRLIDSGYVSKTDKGYTLSIKGLQYADKHSSDLKDQRPQPKLVTILRLENQNGDVLLVKKSKQPYIGLYNFPSGKIHEGESISAAGERELVEKAGIKTKVKLENIGTVHLMIFNNQTIISESYCFVLQGRLDDFRSVDGVFVSPISCSKEGLMPGVKQILNAQKGHLELKVY